MTGQHLDRGRIEYTGRALLQDAQEAMVGNIVRGLVELITNSDDAYARLGDNKKGRIIVEVEHRRKGKTWKVVVRDRASGMSQEELKTRITRLGERSSGFERGLDVRGNRGRGAKDLVAFGPVEFETIKDNLHSYLRLEQDGSYQISHRPRHPTEQDREGLGVKRGNGTVVTVEVAPSICCPQHDNLITQLQRHYQLRGIMADPSREVTLVNANDGSRRRLTYQVDDSEFVVDQALKIEAYPEAQVHLRLWRLPERCERPRSDPTRHSGILVKGRRAIYENSLFSYESSPHAGWYAGLLECPLIDQLAREYDDRQEAEEAHPETNPTPIISRRREGLAPDHPFARALGEVLDEVLRERVRIEEERQRKEAGGIENENTRRALSRMAREAARFLQEAMREIESEEPTGGLGEAEALMIVPPEAIARMGEEKTLSVLARAEGLSEGARVSIVAEPDGVVEVLDGVEIVLSPHRRREDLRSGQIHLRALTEDETLLTATVEDREACALVAVKPPIEEEPEEPAPEVPETLVFERPRYQVRWNKHKKLTLRAPAELLERQGQTVAIVSDDEGVVVTGGARASLKLDEGTGIASGQCEIQGRKLGAKAKVRATLGDQIADCRVSVEERDEGLPDLKIELVDEQPSLFRALFGPPQIEPGEKQVLKVYALHRAISSYIGLPPDYPGQDTAEWKAVLAEVVTEAIVRRIVTRKYPVGTEDLLADQIYYDHVEYAGRLLPVMQRVLRT